MSGGRGDAEGRPRGPDPCPPGRAVRILRRALHDDPAAPAILGDLHEDFVRQARRNGEPAARRWYWKEALLLAAGRLPRLVPRWLRSVAPVRPADPSRISRPSHAGDPRMPDLLDLHGLRQDAAYAWRSLRRNPGFALFTAAVIGLGVGAATAVFSIVEPLVLAPLPFEQPDRLVWISNDGDPADASLSALTSRTSNLRDFRERARSFEAITGYSAFFEQTAYTITGTGEPARLAGVDVAHDFLEVLGVEPLHGRGFTAEEGAWDGPEAVILTHGLWTRRFGADPGVVGSAVTLNEVPRTVVGVLPPTFDFASTFTPGTRVDFLLPIPISDETDRWGNMLFMIGRLRPGVTPEAAEAELQSILEGLREAQPDRWGLGARLVSLREHIAGPFRPALGLLAGAAATLLLIAAVNVSNLLLARAPGRAREVAVRKAMGASRGRMMRQLVMETVGVGLAGALLGAGLAWAVTRVVATTSAVRIPLLDRVAVDGTALAFAAGLAVVTGLLVGLVPALHVEEGNEADVLRSSGRGTSAGRGARRLREALVVSEVALACVLLVVGGLLLRSFGALMDVDLGFEPDGVVAWQINPSERFETSQEVTAWYAELTDRVEALPGIEVAGLNDALPLGRNRTWGFSVVGVPEEEDTDVEIFPHIVGPGYLPALGIPLVAGRNLTRDDTRDAPPVLMMNESGARRVFDGEPALGRRIRLWDEREWEVVGIVRDVRHVSPELGPGNQVYFSMAQMGDFQTMELAVRSDLPTEQVVAAVSSALREVDPGIPTREFWTMRERVDRSTSARRFTLHVLTGYGAAALFLAGLGIYGVLAQSVAERRAEIGIRMALGASSGGIVWGMMRRTLGLAVLGVVAGGAMALVSGRLLDSLLFGIGAADPLTFAAMAAVIVAVAALAGAVPAARAARVRGTGVLQAE